MEFSFIVGVVMLLAIMGYEGWRRWAGHPFGMLSVANAVFALNFCVSPILLMLVPGSGFENGPFGRPLFMLSIVEMLNLEGDAYVQASFISILAYALMIGGYNAVTRFARPKPLDGGAIPTSWLIWGGFALGAIAVVSLLLFSAQFKSMTYNAMSTYGTLKLPDDGFGLAKMLKLGMLARGGRLNVAMGFLQILVMLGVPAVMMLSAAALRVRGLAGWLLFVACAVVWLAVLVRVYFASGRMELTVFIAFVPLAMLLGVRSTRAVVIGGAAMLAFGLFMVLARHEFFPMPGQTVGVMVEALAFNTGRSVLFLFNEFAFPFPVAAHTMHVTPDVVGYRYFVDLPLAALYMLPSIGGVDTWPEMISGIHNRTVPLQLPFDLVSFGYYSFGIVGVGLVFAALGAALAALDGWLAGTGWLGRVLLAAWMMYLPFRIMYGDPYTSMKTGFGLIVGTVLVLMMAYLANRRKRA